MYHSPYEFFWIIVISPYHQVASIWSCMICSSWVWILAGVTNWMWWSSISSHLCHLSYHLIIPMQRKVSTLSITLLSETTIVRTLIWNLKIGIKLVIAFGYHITNITIKLWLARIVPVLSSPSASSTMVIPTTTIMTSFVIIISSSSSVKTIGVLKVLKIFLPLTTVLRKIDHIWHIKISPSFLFKSTLLC